MLASRLATITQETPLAMQRLLDGRGHDPGNMMPIW
jgi:hypothetical protein